jgi:SpoVK/Ycf46/Vps4 family AAA+-type ATPase
MEALNDVVINAFGTKDNRDKTNLGLNLFNTAVGTVAAGYNAAQGNPITHTLPGQEDDTATKWKPVKSNVTWKQIKGMEETKKEIDHVFINPILYPNLFKPRKDAKTKIRSLLLYGPPGTGKTFIVKGLINHMNNDIHHDTILYSAEPSLLISKFHGETEKQLVSLFDSAEQEATIRQQTNGKQCTAVIFMDEVESIAMSRSAGLGETDSSSKKVLTQLLQVLDGVRSYPHIYFICATNYPWQLDDAFTRRITKTIMVDLPDMETIQYLVRHEIVEWCSNAKDDIQLLTAVSNDIAKMFVGNHSGTLELLTHWCRLKVTQDGTLWNALVTHVDRHKPNIQPLEHFKGPSIGYSNSDISRMMQLLFDKIRSELILSEKSTKIKNYTQKLTLQAIRDNNYEKTMETLIGDNPPTVDIPRYAEMLYYWKSNKAPPEPTEDECTVEHTNKFGKETNLGPIDPISRSAENELFRKNGNDSYKDEVQEEKLTKPKKTIKIATKATKNPTPKKPITIASERDSNSVSDAPNRFDIFT